jgi:RNA polymerase sigma-70 factor (ECF subfamily)
MQQQLAADLWVRDDQEPIGRIGALADEFAGDDAVDAQTVLRFQSGDRSGFVDLYERHFSRIYSYLRVLLRDHHEAEDTAQQTFVKAYQALPAFRSRKGAPFRCWLFRIARNEALGHMRKHGRIQVEQIEQIELRRDGESAPAVLSWLTDSEVLLFVERLPPTQRQVLAMRYGLAMTTQETAEALDRTPVAVRKLEHRALRFLEQRLESTGRRGVGRSERAAMLIRLRRAPVLSSRRFALAGPALAPAFRSSRW